MAELKVSVGIVSFSYGGNGGIRSEVPDVRDWMIDTIIKAKSDPRVASICHFDLADTPITMTRNRSVLMAREMKLDFLIMVDSDMQPDCEPDGKPFWDEAFNFAYNHYHKGPVVVAAPYCGPPPNENVYIFRWRTDRNDSANPDFRLSQWTREEAAMVDGIVPVAALPTGLILYDMRIFDMLEPEGMDSKPWFYYEYKDKYQSEKASTEDVTATRDMSLVGQELLGYNPVFCAFSSWAGHWKPCLVRKPRTIESDHVTGKFSEAIRRNRKGSERTVFFSATHGLGLPEGSSVAATPLHGVPPTVPGGGVLSERLNDQDLQALPKKPCCQEGHGEAHQVGSGCQGNNHADQ